MSQAFEPLCSADQTQVSLTASVSAQFYRSLQHFLSWKIYATQYLALSSTLELPQEAISSVQDIHQRLRPFAGLLSCNTGVVLWRHSIDAPRAPENVEAFALDSNIVRIIQELSAACLPTAYRLLHDTNLKKAHLTDTQYKRIETAQSELRARYRRPLTHLHRKSFISRLDKDFSALAPGAMLSLPELDTTPCLKDPTHFVVVGKGRRLAHSQPTHDELGEDGAIPIGYQNKISKQSTYLDKASAGIMVWLDKMRSSVLRSPFAILIGELALQYGWFILMIISLCAQAILVSTNEVTLATFILWGCVGTVYIHEYWSMPQWSSLESIENSLQSQRRACFGLNEWLLYLWCYVGHAKLKVATFAQKIGMFCTLPEKGKTRVTWRCVSIVSRMSLDTCNQATLLT